MSFSDTTLAVPTSTPPLVPTHRLYSTTPLPCTVNAGPSQFCAKLSSITQSPTESKQAVPPVPSEHTHSSITPRGPTRIVHPWHRRTSQSYTTPPAPSSQHAPPVPSALSGDTHES